MHFKDKYCCIFPENWDIYIYLIILIDLSGQIWKKWYKYGFNKEGMIFISPTDDNLNNV